MVTDYHPCAVHHIGMMPMSGQSCPVMSGYDQMRYADVNKREMTRHMTFPRSTPLRSNIHVLLGSRDETRSSW